MAQLQLEVNAIALYFILPFHSNNVDRRQKYYILYRKSETIRCDSCDNLDNDET